MSLYSCVCGEEAHHEDHRRGDRRCTGRGCLACPDDTGRDQALNAASEDWHTTTATMDLRVGGSFSSRMEAKDGSADFDFAGTCTKVRRRYPSVQMLSRYAVNGSPDISKKAIFSVIRSCSRILAAQSSTLFAALFSSSVPSSMLW